ncbi:hypothetical protein CDIK_0793 [Cucumispora dikerogammari]|nr:hypothetical protein CDIK_0793 [Cucumispora dikerogammari]
MKKTDVDQKRCVFSTTMYTLRFRFDNIKHVAKDMVYNIWIPPSLRENRVVKLTLSSVYYWILFLILILCFPIMFGEFCLYPTVIYIAKLFGVLNFVRIDREDIEGQILVRRCFG